MTVYYILYIDENDYNGEAVMIIQNNSCHHSPVIVDLIRNHTPPYSFDLVGANKNTVNASKVSNIRF